MREGVGALKCTVGEEVSADFPLLRLWSMTAAVPRPKTPKPLRIRLESLDDRVRGIATGSLRSHGITRSYRAFARQLGLDPDIERNPLEQAAVQRLMTGRMCSGQAFEDALLVGMLETGIPLWALDAQVVSGWLSVEATADGGVVTVPSTSVEEALWYVNAALGGDG